MWKKHHEKINEYIVNIYNKIKIILSKIKEYEKTDTDEVNQILKYQ